MSKMSMESLIQEVKSAVAEAKSFHQSLYLDDIVDFIVPVHYSDIADVLLSDVSLGLESPYCWEDTSCIWDAISHNIYESLMEVAIEAERAVSLPENK